MLLPEAPHRERQADRDRWVRFGDGPAEDGADVVVLELEAVEPASLVGAGQLPGGLAASATYQSRWRAWRSAVSPRAASCSAAYSRIVSRSRNRVSPAAPSSGLTRL